MQGFRIALAVHGGVGNPTPGEATAPAAHAGLQALRTGAEALDAAVAAVTLLEDDDRFNAGTGACLDLDGETAELDAAAMDSTGRLGAVACLLGVRNPVQVARLLADTPHTMLAGEGAQRFARLAGFAEYDVVTDRARARHRLVLAELADPAAPPFMPGKDNALYRRWWNFPMPWEEAVKRHGHGTVGAVALDARGRFAVATSTGGSTPMLLGRVGDTPLVGSGFYAGPAGAIACTGVGEFIVRQVLAFRAYAAIEAGTALAEALDAAIARLDPDIDVGLVGVTRTEIAVRANRPMPSFMLTE